MKTNSTMTAPMPILCMNKQENLQVAFPISMTRKEKTALKVIYNHAGKRLVFETYSKINPEMANKYLHFISKNPWAVYIKWDDIKMRFVA
jgi:ribosomal protein S7